MAKCKNCKNIYNLSDENDVIVGKWCPKIVDSPDIGIERECKYYDVMTRADWIRSLKDEELAMFLRAWACDSNGWCDDCTSINGRLCNETKKYGAENEVKWLKEPMEEK